MATLIVTKNKGGVGRPAGMTVVPPAQEVPLQALQALGARARVDGVALADLLSAITMHDRAAARFARAAAQQSTVPQLREIHLALADGLEAHVSTLEALMAELGLPRLYVSPGSRMAGYLVERLTQAPLLAGSISPEAMEFTLIDVALTVAEKCLADASALKVIATKVKQTKVATALSRAVQAMTGDTSVLARLRTARQSCLVTAVTQS